MGGLDPYKFTEIRSLGLINEQIDWKQRFFVPTDEETGNAGLRNLFARYPIIPSAASDERQVIHIEPQELSRPQRVNLDEWFVRVRETELVSSVAPDEVDDAELASGVSSSCFVRDTTSAQHIPTGQLALDFG